MNKLPINRLSILVLAMAASLTSCDVYKDDCPEKHMPTALVTVKPIGSGRFIMQLDDVTRLEPTNMPRSPYGEKTVRALVNYNIEGYTSTGYNGSAEEIQQRVHVNWIDSIRTKMPVPTLGPEEDSIYGNDPLEIVKDWVTVAEDGFLTLRIRTRWGHSTTHQINLLTGVNPENPYEIELRHNAMGDMMGNMGDALIAFNLRDIIKDAKTENVGITLRYRSFSGENKIEFSLNSRPMDDLGPIEETRDLNGNIN